MARELQSLIQALHLEQCALDQYVGLRLERNLPRVFGGLVLAQALVAAATSTREGLLPHSCHAYFMRGGDSRKPITYSVERMHDGRSFCTRNVRATQGERLLFQMSTSFHAPEKGLEHNDGGNMAEGPYEAIALENWTSSSDAPLSTWWTSQGPFEIRFTERPVGLVGGDPLPPRQTMWIRPRGDVPFDPVLNAALLAFASDLHLLGVALLPHGRAWTGEAAVNGASLDHAMWFHRPGAWNDWLQCSQESSIARGARGFASCTFRNRAGDVVATASQEGLLRIAPTVSSD